MTTKVTKTKKAPKASHAALRAAMASLASLTLKDLRARYETATSQPGTVLKKDFLIKTLAARAGQDDARPAAAATAAKAPAKAGSAKPGRARDPRLPAPGTTIKREYLGKRYEVEVLVRGFRFEGKEWHSLTGIALAITKYPAISGPLFFGIAQRKAKPVAPDSHARAAATEAPATTRAPNAKRTAKGKGR
jgi:hypothetical protein